LSQSVVKHAHDVLAALKRAESARQHMAVGVGEPIDLELLAGLLGHEPQLVRLAAGDDNEAAIRAADDAVNRLILAEEPHLIDESWTLAVRHVVCSEDSHNGSDEDHLAILGGVQCGGLAHENTIRQLLASGCFPDGKRLILADRHELS